MIGNIFTAISSFTGQYLMHHIIHYLKNKSPGLKTILDGMHIQLLQYWMVESIAVYLFITLYEFQVRFWILSWIVGFGLYLILLLASLHMLVCLIFRIVLIFYYHTLEEISDKHTVKSLLGPAGTNFPRL